MSDDINTIELGNGEFQCACCGTIFRRDAKNLNRHMARGLQEAKASMLRKGRDEFHTTELHFGRRGHDISLLRHWGLLEPLEKRPAWAQPWHRGSRGLTSFYRITPLGEQFLLGNVKVPSRIVREPGDVNYFQDHSRLVSITQALQTNAQECNS